MMNMINFYYERVRLGIWCVLLGIVALSGNAWAATPINTTNDGSIIRGGTYFNTRDGQTTFTNKAGTGILLENGSNVRGVEVQTGGSLTGNGGTIKIDAPNQVVQLDGNIDVRGILDARGQYLGNGGKVLVNSAYLNQRGNIYANGYSGGLVQFNVGSAAFAGTARIEAKGEDSSSPQLPSNLIHYPQGGTIAVNAKGVVSTESGVTFHTSGADSYINLEGGVVNVEGTLRADGTFFNGGTIRLVSSGQSDLKREETALSASNIYPLPEVPRVLLSRLQSLVNNDGNIYTRGLLISKTAILTAKNDLINDGSILAEATPSIEFGGVISLNAGSRILNYGRISTKNIPGGGVDGIITLSYKDGMYNQGSIVSTSFYPYGGGLIVFSGPTNPDNPGVVAAHSFAGNRPGYGTIVLPNPSQPPGRMFGTLSQTQPNEIIYGGLSFGGSIFLRTSLPGNSPAGNTLSDWFASAKVRNSYDQLGTGEAKDFFESWHSSHTPRYNPLIVSSNDGSSLSLDHDIIPNDISSLTMLTNGNVKISTPFRVGFDYPSDGPRGNYPASLRGWVSIISDSLKLKPCGKFLISGQTDYQLIEVDPRFGPNYPEIWATNNQGAGTAHIAAKKLFAGSPANFVFDRPESSLIIKSPNFRN